MYALVLIPWHKVVMYTLVCLPRREKWSYALIPWCTGALVVIERCKDLRNVLVPIAWRKDVT